MCGSATCACRPVFVIVIRHWRLSSFPTHEKVGPSHVDGSGPTCLQNATEVSNVTPPCQLLSRINTHDLFPLIHMFFISAPGISRGTGYRSVILERVANLLIPFELPISLNKLLAFDLQEITILAIVSSVRFVRLQSLFYI